MSLHDRLTEDLKRAMKARDQLRMDVIRMIKAAVMNKEMEIKKDLDDAEMSRVMTTMIKQRRESVEQFEKGNRAELAAKERQEITILESYLPQALSPEQLSTVVEAVIQETGARSLKEMGLVMKAVMVRVAGQAKTAFPMLDMDGHEPPNQIDLILMDVLMPELDGVEACRQIKSRPHLCDIPVIMVTAKSDLSNLQAAFAAGANDYITKPVNSVELLARASSALALKKEMDCRKAREGELRRSNDALQKALRDVKVLRGLIPICASCKKIRNDGGFWQQLEEYIGEHSEDEFSHGICQPCVKKLYPGVYQD
ncbi:MAG: GatB/YqeY domain-containing protein [Nitrospirae bacterium]|nr:GatB/YqeY domain-containing protein [Nitrospirota bacterium]